MLPGIPKEKEKSGPLKRGLRLSVSLQFLSFCGVPLQAVRALNACPIRYNIDQVIITFQRATTLEGGAANRV